MGETAESTVPYTQGKISPVVATVTPPYMDEALPIQTPRPVAIPRRGAAIAAALDWRFQRIVKEVGKMPGQVRTPEDVC